MRRVALLRLAGFAGCRCQPAELAPGPFRLEVPGFELTLRGAVRRVDAHRVGG